MATTQEQAKKAAKNAATTPKKSPTELRAAYAKRGNRLLKTLERASRQAESLMRNKNASDAQRDAVKKAVEAASERLSRIAEGAPSTDGLAIPTE